MCYGGSIFMQVLEGGRNAVNRLYGDIVRDERHRDVVLLRYCEVPERRFSNWTMTQSDLAKTNPSTLLKYSEKPVLDPYAVSGQAR
ncbi:MAG TPA: BLUF domain-containing protein [Acidiferrobacterales bacterium]|nr:BLUF domain-containing protein [Acidiferrobacterales bacterium]